MKITNVKAMVAKIFTVGLLAGAVVLAAPTTAQAQIGIGVRIGPARPFRGPVYIAPAPVVYGGFYGRPFYGPHYGWDRREVFVHDRRFYR